MKHRYPLTWPHRPSSRRRAAGIVAAALALAAGCAPPRPAALSSPAPAVAAPTRAGGCADCSANGLGPELERAIEQRLSDLKARGGQCAVYGAVLEQSYRSGQITFRPYMWRVGSQLASGEAKADGRMVLAREIDSLNVGVRTIDEVLWTLEHEAAHIAFDISNGADAEADRANARVRRCRD